MSRKSQVDWLPPDLLVETPTQTHPSFEPPKDKGLRNPFPKRVRSAALLRSKSTATLALTCLLMASAAGAVEPDEVLANPALETRAREISAGLRCLVCQNQSIDDSNAPLARDLRLLVRERLSAGDTDQDVRRFVVARFGEFVLLRPPFGLHTALLWGAPLALLLAALAALWRRRGSALGRPAAAALTDDEERRLRALVAGDRKAK